ncbi:MAG: 2-dehydro-3-deoxygalactonokinase [Granulosicoccus sp.]
MNLIQPKWIGVDWGTTNLRVFAINAEGKVLAENTSDKGMGCLNVDEFENALLELIERWLTDDKVTPVYACGMVGARQGWQEAQYRTVPCLPVCGQGLTTVNTNDDRITFKILPGLSQQNPCDVMRGEETQIAGLLKLNPSFKGTVCLPGTHSKWVSISDGVVTSFKTFMTGELFSLLSNQSILQHSVSANEWDFPAFLKAALKAVDEPQQTMSKLFEIRASSLLNDVSSTTARSTLSGMLIGQELGMATNYWQKKEVALLGATEVSSLYADTLTELGINIEMINAKQATLEGLSCAVSTVND